VRMYCAPRAEYVAPTWSWASSDTALMVPADNMSPRISLFRDIFGAVDHDYNTEIKEIHVENANNDPFGLVLGGFIKVLGNCLPVCRCIIPNGFLDCHEEQNFMLGYTGMISREPCGHMSGLELAGTAKDKKASWWYTVSGWLQNSNGSTNLQSERPEPRGVHGMVLWLQISS